jgi:2-polyprenyl-3-methyl-5-hydroxy-6-metoxy-1,4-benzoquinol methylase
MNKTIVFLLEEGGFSGLEGSIARGVTKSILSGTEGIQIIDIERDMPFKIGDLYQHKDCGVFAFLKGNVFITSQTMKRLSNICQKREEFSVIAPVSNESKVSFQRQAVPFVYQTTSVFRWASEDIYRKYKDTVEEVFAIDDFCFILNKIVLDALPQERSVVDLLHLIGERGHRLGIAKGVYVHHYGNIYESGRKDILAYVPLNAKDILDVGCARGLFGELLKKRQPCRVTGIDTDEKLLSFARHRLDSVILGDIEEIIRGDSVGLYDCIVCGDLIEHLNNPWETVKGMKKHLRKGGLLVASTPNINNWAIIYEMLHGKWQYVSFSILSGTHIRFFTQSTFRELFKCAGYSIREMHLQSFALPPKGAEFIERIRECMPKINEEELKASEIFIVAQAV